MDASMPSNDDELLALVKAVSLRDFGLPFAHGCRFNPRLRTSGGRYLLVSHDVEFNPRHASEYGLEELVGTIRHELCHYHLHLARRGYRHRDREFRELLAKVGGARFARPLAPPKRRSPRYEYACGGCGRVFLRIRRVDTVRYVCGACEGRLRLQRCLFAEGEPVRRTAPRTVPVHIES